jgi:hypothetical protein
MLFQEEINEYRLKISPMHSVDELNTGLWLCLIGTHEIPPHIALINYAKYYSVTTSRVKAGEPVKKILKAISRKTLPTVFVLMKPGRIIDSVLEESFKAYPTLGNGEHSCLSPISDFFAKIYSPEFGNQHLVFDVLSLAEKNEMLVECRSLFIDKLDDGVLHLPKYTHAQIRHKINSILR